MSTIKFRSTIQPTVELEGDEHDKAVLAHQGLLFTGTDEELAKHYADAGLEMPKPTEQPAKPGPTVSAAAAGTEKKTEA